MLKKLVLSLIVGTYLSLVGCQAQPTKNQADRSSYAHVLAEKGELQPLILQTDQFQIQSFYRISDETQPLRVYIEGDGQTSIKHSRLSADPTPSKPVALELASVDKSANVLYLARPCQFIQNKNCQAKYWSDERFSKVVIDSENQAIDIVKRHFRLNDIELVGFSGGAAVAVLVTAARNDVTHVTTVAGNLDHQQVNKLHKVAALKGSLNPINEAKQLANTPQLHLVGTQDKVIPAQIAYAFSDASGNTSNIHIQTVNASHVEGWKEHWTDILRNL